MSKNNQLNHFYVDVDDLLSISLQSLHEYLDSTDISIKDKQAIVQCFPSREYLNHLLLKSFKNA